MGAPTRTRRRRLRTASQLLLQRAQRLLRRDRKIPRRPQNLVSADERPLRREERSFPPDALPYPDCRSLTTRPTTDEQHRARGPPGIGGGARRNTVIAHRRLRRSARP